MCPLGLPQLLNGLRFELRDNSYTSLCPHFIWLICQCLSVIVKNNKLRVDGHCQINPMR